MWRYLLLLVVLAVAACATYREDLNRGQRLYEESEYERALAIWRYLEADLDSLEREDQARYAYLRGMTDYRLAGGKGGTDRQFRAHARHWLAVAKAIETKHPGSLNEQWKQRMEDALADLNAEVWGVPEEEARALSSSMDVSVQPATSVQPPPPTPPANVPAQTPTTQAAPAPRPSASASPATPPTSPAN